MAALLAEGLVKPGPDESLPVLAEVGVGNDAVTLSDHGESEEDGTRTEDARQKREHTAKLKERASQEREEETGTQSTHTVAIGARGNSQTMTASETGVTPPGEGFWQ